MKGLVIEFAVTAESLMLRLDRLFVIVPALELMVVAEFIERYESARSNTFRLNMPLKGTFCGAEGTVAYEWLVTLHNA